MSKLSKLVSNPELFVLDAIKKRSSQLSNSKVFNGVYSALQESNNDQGKSYNAELQPAKTYIIAPIKLQQILADFFSGREIEIIENTITPEQFKAKWQVKLLKNPNNEVVIVGAKVYKFIEKFITNNKISTKYLDFGFLSSEFFGDESIPQIAFAYDCQAPYYSAQKKSDLEYLLSTINFSSESELINRASNFIQQLLQITSNKKIEVNAVYGEKNKKRILVLGQAEDDVYVVHGSDRKFTNNELVTMAYLENPGAQIIYKPHQDVLLQRRPTLSNPKDVAHICQILDQDISIVQALEGVDHVYTITSPEGLEALIRGVKVTTLGSSFYSGWGLTDDRQQNERRGRELTLEQFVAVVYFKYFTYFDPIYKKQFSAEEAVERFKQSLQLQQLTLLDRTKREQVLLPAIVEKTPIFLIGFSYWKTFIADYFPNNKVIMIDKEISSKELQQTWLKQILATPNSQILVWGVTVYSFVLKFAEKHKIPLFYVEDGFIRSVALGSTKAPPFSLSIDSKTSYFDATKESDLEVLLNNFDFEQEPELIDRAKNLINKLVTTGISKYNQSKSVEISRIYGEKTAKRILVVGQVEDDASILYGSKHKFTNNDLVQIAYMENPDAQIIYKPHPDVLNKKRPSLSDPNKVQHLCQIIRDDVPLAQSFETIDHVYTITSQAGFEALIRGIPVTTMGCPFYSGWGLTDERQPNERRKRKLTIEQLVAIVYFKYLKYFDPIFKKETTPEEAIDTLLKLKAVILKEQQFKESRIMSKPLSVEPIISEIATKEKEEGLPYWFNTFPDRAVMEKIGKAEKLSYLYFPWIPEHGDTLIGRINKSDDVDFIPFHMIARANQNTTRQDVKRFARENPFLYRRLVVKSILPYKDKISGFIFTLDWVVAMRIVVDVCKEFSIPTILIPHESVFVNRDMYYVDPKSFASVPNTDLVLAWGDVQESIYAERGYPLDHLIKVGAPKFDIYTNYQPILTRSQFCNLFNLSENKGIILFASQPLDSQLNLHEARDSQRRSITDLIKYSEEHDYQLLIRMPPSDDDILGQELIDYISKSNIIAVDEASCYLVQPEEALYHSQFVASVNSTMLFEAILMGRYSFSMKYIEFEQIWKDAKISTVTNYDELYQHITKLRDQPFTHPEEGMQWAGSNFGIGYFDGKAYERILDQLRQIPLRVKTGTFNYLNNTVDRFYNKELLDVMAIPSKEETLQTTQHNLYKLLNVNRLISSANIQKSVAKLASVDLFVQWGITPNQWKFTQAMIAKKSGKPTIIIEDGFIRSVDIGLSGEPTLSIITDDLTAYYDATKPSRLEKRLQNDANLTEVQIARARQAMDKIVTTKVSKYNHAKNLPLQIGRPDVQKILVIDQRYGDQSVPAALADETSFETMLYDALRNHPDADIIIKQHPDAIKGGKSSYYSNERLAAGQFAMYKNLYTINFDINPYSVLDKVDEVYVVASGMGFEALMAGKKVHCYGMPYYAGWGVTEDKLSVDRRTRPRTVEEIFHYAYIEMSRYFDPEQDKLVEIEEILDYVIKHRGW